MKTDELIGNLSRECLPVRRAPSVAMTAAQLMLIPAAVLAVEMRVGSLVRPGWDLFPHRPMLLVLMPLAAALFAWAASVLAVPGRADYRLSGRLGVAAAALLALSLFLSGRSDGEVLEHALIPGGFECTGLILFLAVLPAAAGLFLLKRRAVTRPGLAGALCAAAAVCLAVLVVEYCCPLPFSFHRVSCHLGVPLWVGASLGAAIAAKALKW
jgi:hypothetical protein